MGGTASGAGSRRATRARARRTGRRRDCSASPFRPTTRSGRRRPSCFPSETADVLRAVRRPAGSSSATHADGIVRVINHGTDHARPGDPRRRLPALRPARLLHGRAPAARRRRLARAARAVRRAAVDAGRARDAPCGHALELLVADGAAAVGVAASVDRALDRRPARPGHARLRITGDVEIAAARITVQSIVRGPWEVRLVRVDESPTGWMPRPPPAHRRLGARR